jgi:hypothetical protein
MQIARFFVPPPSEAAAADAALPIAFVEGGVYRELIRKLGETISAEVLKVHVEQS